MKKLGTLAMGAAILLATAACGEKKDEGGLTAQDNQELNNAAEMLDASPDSLIATDNVALGDGETTAVETGNGTAGNDADAIPGNSE